GREARQPHISLPARANLAGHHDPPLRVERRGGRSGKGPKGERRLATIAEGRVEVPRRAVRILCVQRKRHTEHQPRQREGMPDPAVDAQSHLFLSVVFTTRETAVPRKDYATQPEIFV